MRPRPLIVGEAPTAETEGRPAFHGRCARFLERAAGLPEGGLRAAFRATNLLERPPARQGKGHAFPWREAAPAAERVLARTRGPLIVAGKRAARAFGLSDPQYLRWTRVGGRRVAVIPHPSGINRWWNDPANRGAAEAFLRGAARGDPERAG